MSGHYCVVGGVLPHRAMNTDLVLTRSVTSSQCATHQDITGMAIFGLWLPFHVLENHVQIKKGDGDKGRRVWKSGTGDLGDATVAAEAHGGGGVRAHHGLTLAET
ncbi:hypothetical protein D0Y65_015809 [Glycine soja]|uniref:Uncharacterized protein n=1 Tax=Glycine soja TaxID=3848 RepID=A0A445KEE1_GLYSO|nr:hypothetical protein D0Y65_015809 [Glycine soja]